MHINYFLQHDLPFYPDIEAATADQILPMIRHNLGIGFIRRHWQKKPLKKAKWYSSTSPQECRNAKSA